MKKLVLVSLLGAVLAGCGGGGGSDDKSDNNNNHRPNAAQGTIERVSGNVITVNGHQYDVASVNYLAGDENVALSTTQLSPGMLVALSPNPTRAVGQHVQLEPTIAGIITITNKDSGQFTVNGVALTFPKLSALVDQGHIRSGDWVMVSSLPTATDGYKVLSVVKFENEILKDHFEIEGTISNLDKTNLRFNLSAALTVIYTQNSVEGGELANGLWVEVEGKAIGNTINATEVEIETYDDIDNDTEIEGLLTWVANDKSAFELNYRGRFNVTAQTRFEDGNKNHLVQGTMIEVTTGTNNTALEIEFDNDNDDSNSWNGNDIDIEGTVNSIDETNMSFTIGSRNIDTVYVNRFTEFDDGLTFRSLTQQEVEVEAFIVNGQYIASEIERLD